LPVNIKYNTTPKAQISEDCPLYGNLAANYGDIYGGVPQYEVNLILLLHFKLNPKSIIFILL